MRDHSPGPCGRLRAELSGFAVDTGNHQAIAELCRRLEGIPLAIELAAVRLRAMSPEQILARIENRFGLLSMGDPTVEYVRRLLGARETLCG